MIQLEGLSNMPLPLQVDLFAAGVAIYRLATGDFPFQSHDELHHFEPEYPAHMSADLCSFIQVHPRLIVLNTFVPFTAILAIPNIAWISCHPQFT